MRYIWTDLDDGFTIEDTILNSKVELKCNGYGTTVDLLNNDITGFDRPVKTTFSILQKYEIWSSIVSRLYKKHHLNKEAEAKILTEQETDKKKIKFINGKTNGIAKSQIKKTEKMLGKEFKKHYDAVIAKCVDEKVLKFNKTVFRMIGPKKFCRHTFTLSSKSFYEENKFYINDVINYPAAVIVLCYYRNYYDRWFQYYYSESRRPLANKYLKILRKNLMNVPSGISLDRLSKVCGGVSIYPKEIYTSPIHYKFLIEGVMHDEKCYLRHQVCLESSTIKQFKRAAKLVGRHLRRKFDLRKKESIQTLCQFLLDCPEPTGKVVSLAERSIIWHRRQAEEAIKLQLKMENPDTETAKPPIELPNSPNITFLDTIGKVVQEGINMGHCIAGYAKQAVNGKCYLFHIEYDGEVASAEIRCNGYLSQVRGPKNCDNNACKYGKKVLGVWASKLRKHLEDNKTHSPYTGMVEDDEEMFF